MKGLLNLATLGFVKGGKAALLPPGFSEMVQLLLGPIEEDTGVWKFIDSINPSENPSIVESNVLVSDGSAVLTFADLTGVTVATQDGTSTAAKVGNTITLTAGYINDLTLTDGTHLKFGEGAGKTMYDVGAGSGNAIASGGYSWGTETERPDNLLDGFNTYLVFE